MSGVTLLASLGCWQISRGLAKENLLSKANEASSLTPYSVKDILQILQLGQPKEEDLKKYKYHPVKFISTFDSDHIILLDNIIKNSHPGYAVYVPAKLDEHTVILVSRGWIPLGRSRSIVPQLPSIPLGEVTIEGYLDFAYRNRFISSAMEGKDIQWPLTMQQLDLALLSHALGKSVYPMLVNLDIKEKGETLKPERHYAYAFQWFALAVTLLVFYFISKSKGRK
jgi:surfeit locus 1 family protein